MGMSNVVIRDLGIPALDFIIIGRLVYPLLLSSSYQNEKNKIQLNRKLSNRLGDMILSTVFDVKKTCNLNIT